MIPKSTWDYRAKRALIETGRAQAEEEGDGDRVAEADAEWDELMMYRDKYRE